jgi:hypothetical protein
MAILILTLKRSTMSFLLRYKTLLALTNLAIISVMYLLGMQNLIYIGFVALMLIAIYVVFGSHRKALLTSTFFLPIVLAPIGPPANTVLAHMKEQYSLIPPQGYNFIFDTQKLKSVIQTCSLDDARLVVQGKELSNTTFTVGNKAITPNIDTFQTVMSRAQIPLKWETIKDTINLRIAPQVGGEAKPSIYQGPSHKNGKLYLDAVFLVAENSKCRVFLHAARQCQSDCAAMNETFFTFEKLS